MEKHVKLISSPKSNYNYKFIDRVSNGAWWSNESLAQFVVRGGFNSVYVGFIPGNGSEADE